MMIKLPEAEQRVTRETRMREGKRTLELKGVVGGSGCLSRAENLESWKNYREQCMPEMAAALRETETPRFHRAEERDEDRPVRELH